MVDGEAMVMMMAMISSNSPSRQGARMEFLVLFRGIWWWRRSGTPSGKTSNPPEFLGQKASYRRRGRPRGCLGPSHHALARPVLARAWGVWPAPGPPPSRILAPGVFWKNRHFGFCPVQFREYSFSDFPGTKNSRKQVTGTMALVNRLVQEII